MRTDKQYFKPGTNSDNSNELAAQHPYPELNQFLYPRMLQDVINRYHTDFKVRFATFCFFADAFILNFSFFIIYFIRKSSFALSLPYLKLFIVMNVIWLPISLFNQKFSLRSYRDFNSSFFTVLKSTLYIAYVLTIIIVVMELLAFSRTHVFGTCILYGVIELVIVSVYFLIRGKEIHLSFIRESYASTLHHNVSLRKLLANFILVTGAFYALNYFKRGSFILSSDYEKVLFLIYGVWFISSIYTGKFYQRRPSNFVYAITPYIKAFVLSVAVLSVIVFLFRLSFYSRLQIFGTFILLGLAEIILYFLYSDLPFNDSKVEDIESVDEANKIFRQEILSDSQEIRIRQRKVLFSAEKVLNSRFLKNQPRLLEFLREYIDFSQLDATESIVLNRESLPSLGPVEMEATASNANVSPQDTIQRMRMLKSGSLKLFINLHRINDIRRINRYFLEVHKKLFSNAIFVGRVETIHTHKLKILLKYPNCIGKIMYYLNFVFCRIFPKIPFIKNVYFSLTRGKNRVLSQAEVLGRLYFCGFKVVATREINNCLYFIAHKIKHPSIDKNPSYGPIIKLRRIGFGGKVIFINKFRTMHPYSEYLQEYIYENFKLDPKGKFRDDLRVTSWGRIFRKFWIDELPQIANFFKGDIALIGVRALSQHYFDLYPKDLQELRTQFYPGLIPPYYADMPESFEQIVESERRYLEGKKRHPFTTDIKYLGKAFVNIIFKHARST